ncbi:MULTISPECIES: hypothetical protein [Streptacidiphilus]|uniref:Helix-turn-helix domain-containing protein n=1 Tax=Streptacidiphilus cavernicola TaxID=3342716 RepID=A0ABV6UW58_9ACTN|nr:hypothetical protein [Streptacidiphilus jeojiense]
MQLHPLATVVDRIDPRGSYTTRDIADLLRVSDSTVHSLLGGHLLPGGRRRTAPGGGVRWAWTGRALLRAAQLRMDTRRRLPHQDLSPLTLWRLGCRCERCTAAHNDRDRDRRRQLADTVLTEDIRRQLLATVAAGAPASEAAAAVGVSAQRVYGVASRDQEFAAELAEAGWSLCAAGRADARCSTPAAYRDGCRGTGCRLARREANRRP